MQEVIKLLSGPDVPCGVMSREALVKTPSFSTCRASSSRSNAIAHLMAHDNTFTYVVGRTGLSPDAKARFVSPNAYGASLIALVARKEEWGPYFFPVVHNLMTKVRNHHTTAVQISAYRSNLGVPDALVPAPCPVPPALRVTEEPDPYAATESPMAVASDTDSEALEIVPGTKPTATEAQPDREIDGFERPSAVAEKQPGPVGPDEAAAGDSRPATDVQPATSSLERLVCVDKVESEFNRLLADVMSPASRMQRQQEPDSEELVPGAKPTAAEAQPDCTPDEPQTAPAGQCDVPDRTRSLRLDLDLDDVILVPDSPTPGSFYRVLDSRTDNEGTQRDVIATGSNTVELRVKMRLTQAEREARQLLVDEAKAEQDLPVQHRREIQIKAEQYELKLRAEAEATVEAERTRLADEARERHRSLLEGFDRFLTFSKDEYAKKRKKIDDDELDIQRRWEELNRKEREGETRAKRRKKEADERDVVYMTEKTEYDKKVAAQGALRADLDARQAAVERREAELRETEKQVGDLQTRETAFLTEFDSKTEQDRLGFEARDAELIERAAQLDRREEKLRTSLARMKAFFLQSTLDEEPSTPPRPSPGSVGTGDNPGTDEPLATVPNSETDELPAGTPRLVRQNAIVGLDWAPPRPIVPFLASGHF